MSASKKLRYTVWLAAGWAFLFACMSFYWAGGGNIGLATLGNTIERTSTSNSFALIVWLTGAMKAGAGLLALSLLYKWGVAIPSIVRLIGVIGTGVICLVYGLLNMGARALMALGAIPTPHAMHSAAGQWHLLFWNPWWLLGGVLFLFAAYYYHKQSKQP